MRSVRPLPFAIAVAILLIAVFNSEAIRLRVVSETPVDVRMYMLVAGHKWISKDFTNQTKGGEISSYRCDSKPDYKIYSHAAGSAEAWPKP
jgi:hypothetical protein